jgi:hypothetical protein
MVQLQYLWHLHPLNRNSKITTGRKEMIGIRQIVFLLLAVVPSCCVAQNHTIAVLHQGTPVSLSFAEPLNTSTAAIGDRVNFVLANEITVNGEVVAKAGCTASGQITEVVRAALAGRSGRLTLKLDGLIVGDKKVKLRASRNGTGENDVRYGRPYHLKWPMGLLRTGDNVVIGQETLLSVFVAEDISLPAAR